MAYRVELTDRAVRDLAGLYEEKHVAESPRAARWFNGLERAVLALETYPHRYPVAPESKKAGRVLRHLLYGRKPHIYRVIYDADKRMKRVTVLTIRHGARELDTLI